MIIRKIEVRGPNKPTAALEFKKGLNVVAGASNTGKSYVVQCIQFILGSSKPPKAIDESLGYEDIKVTFEENNGTQFSLRRKLVANAEAILHEHELNESFVLKGKHKGGLTNISNRLLSKFDLNDKFLLKSKENLTTQALTLRTLEKVFVIDETRIVADYSPLGTGQNSERTLESSFLSTLLTGVDDVAAKKLRVESESKSALERKINSVEELIEKIYPSNLASTLKIEEIDEELIKLEKSLKKSDDKLIDSVALNQNMINTRTAFLREISIIEKTKQEETLLIDRFKLLREKYESDKSRLWGIGEAAEALDNFILSACPTCGQSLDKIVKDDEINHIFTSAYAEVKKINLQLRDLNKAINELQLNSEKLSSELKYKQNQFTLINAKINSNIKEIISESNHLKKELHEKQFEYINQRSLVESRNKALIELGLLRVQASNIQASYEANNFENELAVFVNEVNSIFERWGYPDYNPTTYSTKDRDIVIGGKPRSHFGKGYRAIAFSAFAIGLMTTLSNSGRHPGFVVLDSPLTTYKQADKDRGDEDESVLKNMVYSFYRDLCDSYKDHQIIVFENQEPDGDLIPMMKYEHFSKNINVGRYGFFQ